MIIFKSKYIYKPLKISILLFIICFPLSYQNVLFSQISFDSYVETGSNAVSQGIYGGFSANISGRYQTASVSTGGLLSFTNAKKNVFSAYSFGISNDFKIKDNKINIAAFYLFRPFSADLRQTNFSILAKYRTNHFGYSLGINSRIYSFSKAAIRRYNFNDTIQTSILEPINLMYKLSYYHSFSSKLNLEASITNYDRYYILQETNPMILAKLSYYFNSKLQFYNEMSYLQAGLLNIRVNYFGFNFRGGIVWHI